MMPPISQKKTRPGRFFLGFTLALGLTLGNLTPPSFAAQPQTAWPVRNFLPPIATINPKLSEQKAKVDEGNLEPVALSAINSPTLHTTPKVDRLATDLKIASKDEQSEALMAIQQKVDEADLENLWQATVEKNPVIRFSLEKLATPADLQSKQSSKFLSKTLSVLISGATMGATMIPGASAYRNMGSMAVGNALQNLANGNTKPTPNSLSATEQIQLAGLIDELKLKLIHNYQDYKSTLQTLAEARENTIKNNNLYSKALASKNDMAIMGAGSAYYKALMYETTLRQQAKIYRLQLERLAGTDAVARLELAAHISPNGKTATDTQTPGATSDASSSATLSTNAQVMPAATPSHAKASQENVELPQAMMEIGPSLSEGNTPLIGPPLPALSSNSTRVKSKRVMVKNYSDANQPLPIPDKIMEHGVVKPLPAQEKK